MAAPSTASPFVGPDDAVSSIRSGQHVLVGSGASEPQCLVCALARRGEQLADTEILHLLTLGIAPYAEPSYQGRLRHNALFIGPNVRQAVKAGLADYTPCFLSEVPGLLRSGRLPVDAALITVSPPRNGLYSLGVSVDILKAAVETSGFVAAQVNARMPWTEGDTLLRQDELDALVECSEPLPELPREEPTAESLWIGRFVARLVEDGSTIQVGIGAIPDAVLAALSAKRNLGVHSEMISDGVLDLWKAGVLTGRKKSLHKGKIIASFCMGSSALYAAVDRNPAFSFHPSDYVNDPFIIAQNERMVSINSALQVDLTGQVAADSIGNLFYSGVGGQVDFIRGAARSKGGRAVIALPSTARKGTVSRIVPCLSEGTGVVTTRADIDCGVTEYGIASLKGRTIRERAVALLCVAHPSFRRELQEAAEKLGYLDAGHVLPSMEEAYAVDLEARLRFRGMELFVRPIKPTDERGLKDLFYSQSKETTYLRFGIPLKALSEKQFQELVAIDYRRSMAVAGFVRERGRERMVAVARYHAHPGERLAEAAFTVHDRCQSRGIGSFLVDYLTWIAREKGLEGFTAEVLVVNPRMRHVLRSRFDTVAESTAGGTTTVTALFRDWKGTGNPAAAKVK